MGLEYDVHTILYNEGIYLTRSELNDSYKEYNNFSGPLGDRLNNILKDPKPFIAFVKERKKNRSKLEFLLVKSLCEVHKQYKRTLNKFRKERVL